MKDDNLRPFPAPKRAASPDWRQPRPQVIGMYALGLSAFTILLWGGGFIDWIGIGLAVAAVAIAASKRDEPPSWAASHHEFGLRTLVIVGAAWVLLDLSKILIITIPIAVLLQFALALWLLVRSVVGIVRALDERRVERPETWLV